MPIFTNSIQHNFIAWEQKGWCAFALHSA